MSEPRLARSCTYCGRQGQEVRPCCADHPGEYVCVDGGKCEEYLLNQLRRAGRHL